MTTQAQSLEYAIKRNRARIAREQSEYQAWKTATMADNDARWLEEDHAEAIRENAARGLTYLEQKAEEARIIANGGAVRCAALGLDDGLVHVIFRTSAGDIGFYMSPEAYHAFPLLQTTTPDDYRRYGELLPAPADFQYEPATV